MPACQYVSTVCPIGKGLYEKSMEEMNHSCHIHGTWEQVLRR